MCIFAAAPDNSVRGIFRPPALRRSSLLAGVFRRRLLDRCAIRAAHPPQAGRAPHPGSVASRVIRRAKRGQPDMALFVCQPDREALRSAPREQPPHAGSSRRRPSPRRIRRSPRSLPEPTPQPLQPPTRQPLQPPTAPLQPPQARTPPQALQPPQPCPQPQPPRKTASSMADPEFPRPSWSRRWNVARLTSEISSS